MSSLIGSVFGKMNTVEVLHKNGVECTGSKILITAPSGRATYSEIEVEVDLPTLYDANRQITIELGQEECKICVNGITVPELCLNGSTSFKFTEEDVGNMKMIKVTETDRRNAKEFHYIMFVKDDSIMIPKGVKEICCYVHFFGNCCREFITIRKEAHGDDFDLKVLYNDFCKSWNVLINEMESPEPYLSKNTKGILAQSKTTNPPQVRIAMLSAYGMPGTPNVLML